jgi:hypothetical protein
MRFLVAIALYALSIAGIVAAFQIAPDMIWPVTPAEHLAAACMVLAIVAKGAGHVVMLRSL